MNTANSEQIFDSLLNEFLEDSTPAKINVSDLLNRPLDTQSAERLDIASQAARNGWGNISRGWGVRKAALTRQHAVERQVVKHKKVGASNHRRRVKGRSPSILSKTLYLLSGVAAGALVAFGSWEFWPKSSIPDSFTANAVATADLKSTQASSDDARLVPSASLAVVESDEFVEAVAPVVEPSPLNAATNKSSERLSMDSLPFSSRDNGESVAKERMRTLGAFNNPKSTGSPVVLGPEQLIALVDDQMEYMWKLRGVSPTTTISDEQWIQRASLKVVGEPISTEELSEFLSSKSETRRQDWLDRVTTTDTFYRYWVDRFSGAILPKLESSESSESIADRNRFKAWLLGRIRAFAPMDEVIQEILVAQGSLTESSPDHSPQAYWWAQVSADGDHSRSTNAITSNLLGHRGSCIRCHDSSVVDLSPAATAVPNAEPSGDESISRDGYWNLASVVSGMSVTSKKLTNGDKKNKTQASELNSSEESTNRVVGYSDDWQPLFYERADRSLQAAKPKLPNGDELGSPSEKRRTSKSVIGRNVKQLASWVTGTSAFDQRQVNWIWEAMFGQPLKSRYLTVETEGLVERQELLEALGVQFRGSRFDLAKIVKTLALTNVFELDSQQCDPVWYITSTPQELADYQLRQRMFASYPATMAPSFRSLKNVASWFRKSHSSELGQASTEHLTLPSSTDSRKVAISSPEVNAAQTQFILRSRVLPKGLISEMDRWLNSSMPWEELVDHAFYMADDAPATKLEQMSARELLNSTRDRRQALQRILASQLP